MGRRIVQRGEQDSGATMASANPVFPAIDLSPSIAFRKPNRVSDGGGAGGSRTPYGVTLPAGRTPYGVTLPEAVRLTALRFLGPYTLRFLSLGAGGQTCTDVEGAVSARRGGR